MIRAYSGTEALLLLEKRRPAGQDQPGGAGLHGKLFKGSYQQPAKKTENYIRQGIHRICLGYLFPPACRVMELSLINQSLHLSMYVPIDTYQP